MDDTFEGPPHLGVTRLLAAARDAEDEIEPSAAKGQADQVFSESISQIDPCWRPGSRRTANSRLVVSYGTSATLLLANYHPARLPLPPWHLHSWRIAKGLSPRPPEPCPTPLKDRHLQIYYDRIWEERSVTSSGR